jgi:hypothetical protein
MSNNHDDRDLDGWLRQRIEPLQPPPGTFEAIRRRARRRKVRKLAVSAGAAVVVIAAAVTVPQVVKLPVHTGGGTPVAEQSTETFRSVNPAPKRSGTLGVEGSGAPIVLPTFGNPVPASFQPTSITYVSDSVGFVIGQAGAPGHCATQWCTSIARTQNDGQTWTGLPAPLTGPPDGASGVGQIRFLEGINGWAFGPELWATHDGGEDWVQVSTHGRRVIDVETVGHRAYALEAACTGTGADYAADCTSFTLYSTVVTKDAWAQVGAATTHLTGTSAALVLTGTTGYLLGPDGQLYSGPVNGSAAWTSQGTLPCQPGPAQADGEPSGALLAAGGSSLYLDCPASGHLFTSADGGSTWQRTAKAPSGVKATSLAATSAGTLVLATTTGIQVKTGPASPWQPATLTGGTPSGGFAWVGMTDPTRGVALPVNAADGTVWVSRGTGGLSWTPSPVQGQNQ